MPVFGPFDQIVASISVSGVINRMTPDLVTEIVGLLRDSTGQITQTLSRSRGC